MTVHHSGYGKVGKREQCSALTYASGIEVMAADGHLSHSPALRYFCQPDAGFSSKYVALVEEIYECSCHIVLFYFVDETSQQLYILHANAGFKRIFHADASATVVRQQRLYGFNIVAIIVDNHERQAATV